MLKFTDPCVCVVNVFFKSYILRDSSLIQGCKPPLQDWADLWRPELAGKISMVDSPREIVGAVLKYMGASYNTTDMSEVVGGREAVQQNLASLVKQVI